MLLVVKNMEVDSGIAKVSQSSIVFTNMSEIDNDSNTVINQLISDSGDTVKDSHKTEKCIKNHIDVVKSLKEPESDGKIIENSVDCDNIQLVNGITGGDEDEKVISANLDNEEDSINNLLDNISELCNIKCVNANDDYADLSVKNGTTSAIIEENNTNLVEDEVINENVVNNCENSSSEKVSSESIDNLCDKAEKIVSNDKSKEDDETLDVSENVQFDTIDNRNSKDDETSENKSIDTPSSTNSGDKFENLDETALLEKTDQKKVIEVIEKIKDDSEEIDGFTIPVDEQIIEIKKEITPLLKDDNMVYIAFPNIVSEKRDEELYIINDERDDSDLNHQDALKSSDSITDEMEKEESIVELKTDSKDNQNNSCLNENSEENNETVEEQEKNLTISIDLDDDLLLIDEKRVDKSVDNIVDDESTASNNHKKNNVDQIVLDDDDDDDPTNDSEIPESSESTVRDQDSIVKISDTVSSEIVNNGDDMSDLVSKTEMKNDDINNDLIIPLNFMKTFKSSLGKMTRDDLEEYCVVKIVEAIVKRSNLSEAEAKLKAQMKCIDIIRKKLAHVTKQNRDLEIVMKNLCNEHKRRKGELIEPVKISRSVGFQVGSSYVKLKSTKMNVPVKLGKAVRTKQSTPSTSNNIVSGDNVSSQKKAPAPPNPADTHRPVENDKSKTTNKSILRNALSKTGQVNNGTQKQPDKRILESSIDLTDDEPPSKQMTLNNRSKVVSHTHKIQNTPNSSQNKIFTINTPQPIANNVNDINTVYKLQGRAPNSSGVLTFPTVKPIGATNQSSNPRISIPIKMATNSNSVQRNVPYPLLYPKHPAPLPNSTRNLVGNGTGGKWLPPRPEIKISRVSNGIVISWIMENNIDSRYEDIASYQIYAYQETSVPPHTDLWKKIGDVKALPLPMACTLTQFMAGYKYYFAVRAVDVKSRMGPFSAAGYIVLNHEK